MDLNMILERLVRMTIPIIAIIFGCSIAIIAIISDYRRKKQLYELYHKERLAAIDKGVEVPPLPEALLVGHRWRGPHDSLRRGLVWVFLGISLYFVLRALHGPDNALLGMPLVAIGLANLLYYVIVGRKVETDPRRTTGEPKNSATKPAQMV